MNILGISAFYHDGAACLVQDGRITAAAQEERFSRKKHDHRYGEPVYRDVMLEKLLDLKADGSFRMDMPYFAYAHQDVMTPSKTDSLFGGPPRAPESQLTKREMDIAASIQAVTEEIMLRIARHAHELVP